MRPYRLTLTLTGTTNSKKRARACSPKMPRISALPMNPILVIIKEYLYRPCTFLSFVNIGERTMAMTMLMP